MVVFVGKSWNSFPRKPRLIAARRAAIPPSGSPPNGGQSPQKLKHFLEGARKKFFQLRNQFLRALLPC